MLREGEWRVMGQLNKTGRQFNMQPGIETIAEKKLVGKRLTMSYANNHTAKLWRSFMPGRKEIINNLTTELISLQVYPPSFDFTFADLNTEFDKWAAIEVSDFNAVPKDMETYILKGGLYAVFHYKGLNTDTKIFHYIYGTWLPGSRYAIDNRPHFEILGEKYKNNDAASEEEIWIPVKPKE
jgi:AraC family transcriptional regulator